jgi:hypothetical protein
MVTLISGTYSLLIGVLARVDSVEVAISPDRTGAARVARVGKEEAESYGLIHVAEPSGDFLSRVVLKVPRFGGGVVLRHEVIAEARLHAEEIV